MRKYLLTTVVLSVFLICCDSTQTKETLEKQFEMLNGSWQLNFISIPRTTFDGLFPGKKPTINFIIKENTVFGNNSCNTYSGKLNVNGKKISFKDPMAVTKMMCGDGKGETVYMETLQKIDSYSVSEDGKTLKFKKGKTVLMLFDRK